MLAPPAITLPVIATLTASVLIAAAALAWYRPRSVVDNPLLVLAVPLLLSLLGDNSSTAPPDCAPDLHHSARSSALPPT